MKKPKTKFARTLRRSQSNAEQKLWQKLRNRQFEGTKFRRQQFVGDYIVDFMCHDKKLIIEVDGGQHNQVKNQIQDYKRTLWLEQEGFKVIRFWNNEILENIEGVLLKIKEFLDTHPHLTSPLKGEELLKKIQTGTKPIISK